MNAARGMLGSREPYREVQFFWTRQTGISLRYAGHASRWDSIAYRGDVEAGRFVAGYYSGGALAAAAGVGMPNDVTVLEEIIKRGIPLPAEKLSDPGFNLKTLVD
jgi:hypothetical protein